MGSAAASDRFRLASPTDRCPSALPPRVFTLGSSFLLGRPVSVCLRGLRVARRRRKRLLVQSSGLRVELLATSVQGSVPTRLVTGLRKRRGT